MVMRTDALKAALTKALMMSSSAARVATKKISRQGADRFDQKPGSCLGSATAKTRVLA